MTNAGLLTGLRDIDQGHGLDIKPYGVGTSESFPGRGARRSTNDATRASICSTARRRCCGPTFTINTDFAQTEVDQRQVNLTRFSLFFPERRDFFLDGATFFDFADGSAGLRPGREQRDQVILRSSAGGSG